MMTRRMTAMHLPEQSAFVTVSWCHWQMLTLQTRTIY